MRLGRLQPMPVPPEAGFKACTPKCLFSSGQGGTEAEHTDVGTPASPSAWVGHGRNVANQALPASERIARGRVKEHKNYWNGENNE